MKPTVMTITSDMESPEVNSRATLSMHQTSSGLNIFAIWVERFIRIAEENRRHVCVALSHSSILVITESRRIMEVISLNLFLFSMCESEHSCGKQIIHCEWFWRKSRRKNLIAAKRFTIFTIDYSRSPTSFKKSYDPGKDEVKDSHRPNCKARIRS